MKKSLKISFICILLILVLIISVIITLQVIKNQKGGLVFVYNLPRPDIETSFYPIRWDLLKDKLEVRGLELSNKKRPGQDGYYATLPFLGTIKYLGYETTFVDDNTVLVKKGKKIFTLLLQEKLFYEEDMRNNLFDCPPDGDIEYYCQRIGDDIYLDNTTLNCALGQMDDYHYISDYSWLGVVWIRKNNRI